MKWWVDTSSIIRGCEKAREIKYRKEREEMREKLKEKAVQEFLDICCRKEEYKGQIFDERLDKLLKTFLDFWINSYQSEYLNILGG